MNRPTGGVQPSVRPTPEAWDDHSAASGDAANGHARNGNAPAGSGPDGDGSDGPPAAVPPRQRSPSPAPAPTGTPAPEPPAAPDAPAPSAPDATAGRASRRARRDADTDGSSTWLREEIRRRVADAAGGVSRHARVDPDAGPAVTTDPDPAPAPEAPGAPATPEAPDDEGDADTPVRRTRPGPPRPRPRSDRLPDPYAPGGMRDSGSGGWPAPSDEAGKQWPPASGSSSALPRRTPGATHWPAPASRTAPAPSAAPPSWSVDRDALIDGPDAAAPAAPAADAEAPPETRPVPIRWTATGRRAPAGPDTPPPVAHPPTAGTVPADPRDLDELDDLDDPDDDPDDLDGRPGELDPHAGLRGAAAERTEVIWRAPDLDDPPVAPVPAPSPLPDAEPGAPGPAPYTGARPRRFAAAPTDAPAPAVVDDDEPDVAQEPGNGRVRIVLSERRSTAHSSRGLSDVQDPGPVGTLLRNTLVRNQLALALRVCVVALVGLGLPPALFVAFPVLGEVSVLGIRLPWLLLGGLVYPFLLGLGWWYVTSAEAVEQEFAEDVTDR